jgi:hypothetical protein
MDHMREWIRRINRAPAERCGYASQPCLSGVAANAREPITATEVDCLCATNLTQDPNCPVTTAPARQISYNDALIIDHMAGVSLDSTLQTYNLNAIVAPTDSPGWTTDLILSDHFLFASSGLAGPPGYPIINVPSGDVLGMPVGVSFIGTAFSEGTLITLGSGFEAATHARFEPTFVGNVTTAHTSGTSLSHLPNLGAPPNKHHHRM